MQDKVKNKKNKKTKKKTKVEFDSEIKKVEASDGILDEKYVGFGKLKSELARKGVKNPGALAAYIGRKKYGEKKFQRASENDKKLNESNFHGPFHGGVKSKSLTQNHKPLVWENMLGTVFARSPEGHIKYFDYDYEGARKHAQVENHHDLRIAKKKVIYNYNNGKENSHVSGPRHKIALWGIHKDNLKEESLNEALGMYRADPIKGTLDQSPNRVGNRVVVKFPGDEYHSRKGTITFSNSKGLHHIVKLDGKERPVSFLGKHLVQIKEEKIEEKMSHSKKYTVNVVVSDPNHQVLSKRDDLVNRRVRVNANSERGAHERAREFYKKKKFQIHDSHVISEENQLDEWKNVLNFRKGDEAGLKKEKEIKALAKIHNVARKKFSEIGTIEKSEHPKVQVRTWNRMDKDNPDRKKKYPTKASGFQHIRRDDADTHKVYVNYKHVSEGNSLEQLASKRAKHEELENRYSERAGNAEDRAVRAFGKGDYTGEKWHRAFEKKYDHKAKRHGQAINVINRLLKKRVNESKIEKDLEDHEPRIVSGVKGMKSRPFSKKFRNQTHMEKWIDSDDYGNHEIHTIQRARPLS